MRGIEIDATRFRQIRRARGLTQRELARLAGIGERTVRSAEAGGRVRFDFLPFLATALGVNVHDLTKSSDELHVATLEQKRAAHITEAIEAMTNERDFSVLTSLVSHAVRINVPGPSAVPYAGSYVGIDEMRRFFDIAEQTVTYERPPVISEVRFGGALVIFSGFEWQCAPETGKRYSGWWQHIYEYEKGRVSRVDVSCDMSAIARMYRCRR